MIIPRRRVLVAGLGLAACRRTRAPAERPTTTTTTTPPATTTPTPAPSTASRATAPATTPPSEPTMLTRPIPRTGEPLPVVGLGTWQVFDVDDDAAVRAPLVEVVRAFLAASGRVIDSSPMYGRAEEVTGDVLAELGAQGVPFLATKVWTRGERTGRAEMDRSRQRLRTDRIDLMQIHNLLDWQTHLPVLREHRKAGLIRYLGITHYALDQLPTIERLMRDEALDFVQVPYSAATRAIEARLLPAAADTGTAVLTMTPFESGALFAQVKGRALPGWAAELGCTSWAQVFLKFVLGHPAVNAPLPATAKLAHLADNVAAGRGPFPDARLRARIVGDLGL